MRISEAIAEFVAFRKARAGGQYTTTVRDYEWFLNRFLRHTGDKQVRSLTAEHAEDFFYGPEGLMSEHTVFMGRGAPTVQPPISPNTHNLYRTRMCVFVKWCLQRRYLTRDIMIGIQPVKVPKKKRNRYDANVLTRLLEVADGPRDRAVIAVCLNTALRASEVIRIKVGDVHLDQGFIDITVKKTGSWDEQPITSDLDPELRTWLTQYALDLGRPLRADDLLFPHTGGNTITHYETADDGTRYPVRSPKVWCPNTQIRTPEMIVKKALGKLGLPTDREGMHTLRRSVARIYYDNAARESGRGSALRETSALLHHSSTTTTEIYLGLDVEVAQRNDRLRGKPFLSALVASDNVIQLRPLDA